MAVQPSAAQPQPVPAGTAGLRCQVVSVRLTATEHRTWLKACQASPRAEVARWAREIINDRISVARRPWAVPILADVNPNALAEVTRLAAALNDLTRQAHKFGHLDQETGWVARAAAQAAAPLVAELPPARTAHPPPPEGGSPRARRTQLVNIRLASAEYERWTQSAQADGWPRVSGWARAVVCFQLDLPVHIPPPAVPAGLGTARRQVGGIVGNLAQLAQIAIVTERLHEAGVLEAAQEQTQHALDELYRVGVR